MVHPFLFILVDHTPSSRVTPDKTGTPLANPSSNMSSGSLGTVLPSIDNVPLSKNDLDARYAFLNLSAESSLALSTVMACTDSNPNCLANGSAMRRLCSSCEPKDH
mmetsp:Transcript_17024/g.47712  ORF Transcript_17024/g.47712 Transcript_17024/m.47712 type:complete len:106 (-) Transcript_17024:17-334(-)